MRRLLSFLAAGLACAAWVGLSASFTSATARNRNVVVFAAAGLLHGSNAASDPSVKVVATFPSESHLPIVYHAALVAGATHAGKAAFLGSPAAKRVFEAQGFAVLSQPDLLS